MLIYFLNGIYNFMTAARAGRPAALPERDEAHARNAGKSAAAAGGDRRLTRHRRPRVRRCDRDRRRLRGQGCHPLLGHIFGWPHHRRRMRARERPRRNARLAHADGRAQKARTAAAPFQDRHTAAHERTQRRFFSDGGADGRQNAAAVLVFDG